jgi:succinoglycan biosynthesis transport protein ExoP
VEISPISPRRPANVEPDVYEPAADLRRIGGVVRRQFKLAAMGAGLAALLALLFLYFVQPLYLSSVKILLDVNQNQLLASSQSSPTPQSATTAEDFVATQMAVIGSEVVAGRVARSLGLTYDPETERLSSQPAAEKDTRLTTAPPAETTDPVDPAVVHALNRALSVFRVEKSMVIEIDVTDPDPALAEAMASAYGQAYLDDQLGARYESARNAATWLENRIVRLRNQSLEANAEVEIFRKQNNLVATDGRLLSDQQLQQLNDRLSEARSNLTRATARETVFSNAVDTRNIDSILSQITSMSGITPDAPILSLRNDYLGANERYREVSARWGAENDQARAIRAEVDRLANQILGEAARLRDGLAGDVRVARSEVDAITNSVASTTSQFQADNSTLVQLRNLEQRATSYNALYLDYLTRYQEAVQQQTLSMTTGRQISNAQKANLPVFPRNKIVLALAVFLGAAFGAGARTHGQLVSQRCRRRASRRSFPRLCRQGVAWAGPVCQGPKDTRPWHGRNGRRAGAGPCENHDRGPYAAPRQLQGGRHRFAGAVGRPQRGHLAARAPRGSERPPRAAHRRRSRGPCPHGPRPGSVSAGSCIRRATGSADPQNGAACRASGFPGNPG